MSEQDQQEVKAAVDNFNGKPDVQQGGKPEDLLTTLYQDVNTLRDNQNMSGDMRSINDQIDMRRAGFSSDVTVVGLGNLNQLIVTSPDGKPNEYAVVSTKGEILKTGSQQDINTFLGVSSTPNPEGNPERRTGTGDPYAYNGSPEGGDPRLRDPYSYSGAPEAGVNHKKTETFNTTVVETDEQGNQTIVVQGGNSLWNISRDLLQARGQEPTEQNKAAIAREIYNLNKDAIGGDWNKIYPGQRFKMPPSMAEKFPEPPPTVDPPPRVDPPVGTDDPPPVPPKEGEEELPPIVPPEVVAPPKKTATMKGDSSETRPNDDRYHADTPPGMDAAPDEQFTDERDTKGGFDHESRKLIEPPKKDEATGEMVYRYSGVIDTGSGESGDTNWTGEQRLDANGNVTFRKVEYDPKFKDELKFHLPDGKEIKLKDVKRVVTALNEESGKYVTQIQLENGRLYEAVTDGKGNTESFNPKEYVERDAQQRVTRVVDAAGRQYKFEYQGNTQELIRVINENGHDFRKEDGKWLDYSNGKKPYNGDLRVDQKTGVYSFTNNETHQTTNRNLDGSTLVVDEASGKPSHMTTRNNEPFDFTWDGDKIKSVKRKGNYVYTRGQDGVHFDGSQHKDLTIEVDPKLGTYSYTIASETVTYYPDGRVVTLKR